jgi:ribosomal protein S18 acetylase RimI-like enzyme
MELRAATAEDVAAIGRVLAAAFDDDPLINWIVRQDERRAWAIEALFREVTRYAYIDAGEAYLLTDGSGAAVWRPPGGEEPSGEPLNAIFDEIVGPRGRGHSNLVGELVEGKHPQSPPHFYLFAIGVDPSMQGAGAGSRLIREVLDRCDREGLPAYLENSKEQNLAFYGKHGFEVRERVDLPNDGPPVWLMWRWPKATL